jgi:hypothetical protein
MTRETADPMFFDNWEVCGISGKNAARDHVERRRPNTLGKENHMAYLIDGERRVNTPKNGVFFQYENPCQDQGHEYAPKICPACGRDFCYSCCGGTNVANGGKYDDDYMLCPDCGHDYYA